MNYKAIWNLSQEDLKKATNAAERLEAARAYVRDRNANPDPEYPDADNINDAANTFSISYADYCRIYDALKKDTRNN